jgi:hypothetical protein
MNENKVTAEEFYWEAYEKADKGLSGNLLVDSIIKIMQDYANLKKSEWCKEQREICADKMTMMVYEDVIIGVDMDSIRNAPEPNERRGE